MGRPTISAFWQTILSAVIGGAIPGVPVVVAAWVTVRRQFEDRFRLEKEYETYATLWKLAFLFNRAVGSLLTDFDDTGLKDHSKDFPRAMTNLQSYVRMQEPLIALDVFRRARKLVRLGWGIRTKTGRIRRLEGKEATDRHADARTVEQLETEREAQVDQAHKLTRALCQAIRKRLMPASALLRRRGAPERT